MAGTEYLSHQTFQTWREDNDRRQSEMNDKLDKVLELHKEVAVLKDRSDRAEKKSYITMVASLIGGAISGALMGGK